MRVRDDIYMHRMKQFIFLSQLPNAINSTHLRQICRVCGICVWEYVFVSMSAMGIHEHIQHTHSTRICIDNFIKHKPNVFTSNWSNMDKSTRTCMVVTWDIPYYCSSSSSNNKRSSRWIRQIQSSPFIRVVFAAIRACVRVCVCALTNKI